jgi:acetolactate synthase-1/2/3 large subunit
VERTGDFAPALSRAQAERGVKLLHLKADVEQITSTTTITKLRARS